MTQPSILPEGCIRMVVDSLDQPQLVFLGEDGDVVKRFMADE